MKITNLQVFGYDNLIANDTVPVVPRETFQGKWIHTLKGDKVIEFGQNMAGFVEFKVHGKPGQKIVIHHAETLDKDGNFIRISRSTGSGICG